MTVVAVIGAQALWLTYAWLGSSIVASAVSNRKGWGERPGLASGMLLNAAGILIWIVSPPRIRLPLPMQNTPAPARVETREELRLKWPLGRVWPITILSGGLYGFYWFGLTRQQVSQELGRDDDRPGLQTIGLIVPLLNLYIVYRLWRDVDRLRQAAGLAPMPVGAWLAVSAIPGVSIVGAPYAYTKVLLAVNEYWDRRTGGTAGELKFTISEGIMAAMPLIALVAFAIVSVL
jgi:hypothetical protein